MIRILLLVIVLLFGFGIQAQVRSIGAITEARARGTNESTRLRESPARAKTDDAVFYPAIIRRNMWYEGLGKPITPAEAKHRRLYYRLSNRNAAGHYQHIQAMCKGTFSVNHDVGTYLMPYGSEVSDSAGIRFQRLDSIAQWVMIPTADPDVVAEERAYTPNGEMVYSFVPVEVAGGRYTGTYNDAWGMPVDVTREADTEWGSVVWIKLDKGGRDSVVDFLDGAGMRKYSPEGVDQYRYYYDMHERLRYMSRHNMVGDFMNNHNERCVFEYIYEDGEYSSPHMQTYSLDRLDEVIPKINALGPKNIDKP